MHSRETVWYIRRRYSRGAQTYDYYYKRELLTTDTYRNLDSVYWSTERPITKRTFDKAARDGYKCDTYVIHLPPIELIQLPERRESRVRSRANEDDRIPARHHGQVIRLLRHRLHKSMGL